MRKYLLGLIFLVGCSQAPLSTQPQASGITIDNTLRNSDQIIAIGHRGENKLAPGNTMAAFDMAIKAGAKSIETDVRTTKDGHLILMHDAEVNSSTNGKGRVEDLTLAEIKNLTVKAIPGIQNVPPQRVPTLEEALLAYRGKVLFDLDVKAAQPAAVVKVLQSTNMLNAAYVDVGSIAEAQSYRQVNPAVAIQIGDTESVAQIQEAFRSLGRVEVFELEERSSNLADLIGAIHAGGAEAHIPEKDAGFMFGWPALVEAGIDGIQTDNLQMLVPYLNRQN